MPVESCPVCPASVTRAVTALHCPDVPSFCHCCSVFQLFPAPSRARARLRPCRFTPKRKATLANNEHLGALSVIRKGAHISAARDKNWRSVGVGLVFPFSLSPKSTAFWGRGLPSCLEKWGLLPQTVWDPHVIPFTKHVLTQATKSFPNPSILQTSMRF